MGLYSVINTYLEDEFSFSIAYGAKLIGGIYSSQYFRLPVERRGLEILTNLESKFEALKLKLLER